MAEAVSAQEITITRVFDAPRELVWNAWTEPDQLARWWGARVYREVVEPERLVLEEPAEDAWHEGAMSVVTFNDLGDGRTEMVFQTTIQTTDEMRGHAEAGVAGSFDRLAEYLG